MTSVDRTTNSNAALVAAAMRELPSRFNDQRTAACAEADARENKRVCPTGSRDLDTTHLSEPTPGPDGTRTPSDIDPPALADMPKPSDTPPPAEPTPTYTPEALHQSISNLGQRINILY